MPLIAFVCLQVLDGLTTLVFLRHGIAEGNPLIRLALASSVRPELALIIPKAIGVALGIFAWRRGRMGLLRRMNLLFAVCVAWNLLAIYRAA